MHPRMAELDDYIGQQRALLTAAVAQIAVHRHGDSPGEGRWSVVNVLEHVAIVEARIGKGLGQWIAEERAHGLARETDTSPILPLIRPERFVDRSRPIKTTAAGEPSGMITVDEAMHRLASARAAVKAAMVDGDGYALATAHRPHPALGPLNLYEWIAFVGGHMQRHAMQVREIGLALEAAGGR
ncbi:MAG TPA: DinB family protein [Gemmatimonadaceae bacterium]|nr:DinB family protein [Gemmatimonadaceae bacterium]